jgi:TolA-binding protein
VRAKFPQSPRAPTALYKIGLLAERRKDVATARATYQRVMQEYPRSEEADLARERLASLKP